MGVGDSTRPSIGAVLKARREERGETFRDVENATKIRTRYLAALEADDIEMLPAEVYALGFLRSYARHLGLDAESLVRAWRARLKEVAPPEPPSPAHTAPPVAEPPPRPAERERRRREAVRPPRPAGVVVAAVALVLILVAVLYGIRHHAPAAPAAVSHPSPAARSSRHHHHSASSTGPTLATTVNTPSQLTMTIKNASPALTLAFSGNCWVEVWVNGVTQNPYGHTYTAGQTFSVSGSQSVEVRLGNPGVVQATVNGHTLGPISQGLVRNLLVETAP